MEPEITPEMYAEMQGQEDPQAQAAAQQYQQGKIQQQEIQQPAPEDQIEQAKDMLGVKQTEEALAEVQKQLDELTQEKVKKTVSANYPNVPFDLVKKEIDKIAEVDPDTAASMLKTETGMDMAYRATLAAMKPDEKPDELTDEGGAGEQEDTLDKVIMKGEADDFDLGEYIKRLSK